MKLISTDLKDVFVVEPMAFSDNRGFFMEAWNKKELQKMGLSFDFVQENHSYSKVKGTLRGIHFQVGTSSQTKMVRCIRGKIRDVVVDLRADSDTYKKWIAVELTAENKKEIIIPKGFGHGFVTLTDDVEVLYLMDEFYSPEADAGIRFDDPDIGIEWGDGPFIMSEKDKGLSFLKEIEKKQKKREELLGV